MTFAYGRVKMIENTAISRPLEVLMIETYKLWENGAPLADTKIPTITYYPACQKATDATVVIFPGGAYAFCTNYEGAGYAYLLNTLGIDAFVVDYRVSPARFPCQLLDARRAVRFVRKNAEKFGISKDKIAVMGSSAGGHLAALVSTYREAIDGEDVDDIDAEDSLPSAQILCYPVISSDESISHSGSYKNLLGERYGERDAFSPELIADEKTPIAFLWHTANDSAVNVCNSYRYAETLRKLNISHELHVFPDAPHGSGVAPDRIHVREWTNLLYEWMVSIGFYHTVHLT